VNPGTAHITSNVSADVVDAIGNTPLVDISALSPKPDVQMFAKLEGANPSGSVKDRVARQMIFAAERDGLLKPGDTIVEPTSGNTGIALAMICRVRDYTLRAVMPESVSAERLLLLKAFGAEVVFSDGTKGTNESILVAQKIVEENPEIVLLYQYGNEANPDAHYMTTGPEIIRDLPDVDVFVAGLGTGGTLMGVGRALREHNADIKTIAVAPHPDEIVQGLRSIEHGFIPPILKLEELDARLMVESDEALFWTRELLSQTGVFAGFSSGAVVAGARTWAKRMDSGKIVCLLADGGWKYMSTGLFDRDYDEMKKHVEGKIWW
jgi:cysteine synthase